MKKVISVICILSFVCCIISGCKKTTQSSEPSSPSSIASSETTIPDGSMESEKTESVFKAGTWMATNGESGQFYFFDNDRSSGRTANYENGIGLGFTYEKQDDKFIFHMGDSTSSLPCQVVVTDDTHITLEWEAQYSETLTFLSPLNSEQFHFYTHEELCELALKEYKAKNNFSEELTAAAADHGDGTVTIQIYQNLSDHNSTVAWYQIDRCTGAGKDVNSGDPIDLTN